MSTKKNKSAKIVFPTEYTVVGTQIGEAIKGDRIVMYAREIDYHKKPIIYTGNHRGQWAKGKGDVICVIEKGIKGGRSREVPLKE